jgi:hypothetical protein
VSGCVHPHRREHDTTWSRQNGPALGIVAANHELRRGKKKSRLLDNIKQGGVPYINNQRRTNNTLAPIPMMATPAGSREHAKLRHDRLQ